LWPPGAGKTFLTIYLIAKISGKTLIVTSGKDLLAQWERFLRKHLFGAEVGVWYGERKSKGDVTVTTYHSASKFKNEVFDLIVADECHTLPAVTFSQLAAFDTKYRLGLTASPYREDGRQDLIFALSGFPYGESWEELVEQGFVKKPDVYVIRTWDKLRALKIILERIPMNKRTLIFCDRIKLGRILSKELDIPYVHGEHSLRKRMEMLKQHKRLLCSRIFDQGMDILDLKCVIEVDFFYGSRRQSLQRNGRLMHSKYKGLKHYIIFTPEELDKYGKRLFSLYERNFHIRYVDV